jgi:hypothetical protein
VQQHHMDNNRLVVPIDKRCGKDFQAIQKLHTPENVFYADRIIV